MDEAFLKALDAANASSTSKTIEALKTALPYVELANTDDDLMNEPPEAILMASAFEQLLEGEASAYTLGVNFGELFKAYGTVSVADALKVRPHIRIDTSTPERAAAQPKWWTHRKWMEELYDVRNKSAHEGVADGKKRGWSTFEHLVIAAFAFPLAVKVLLQKEGSYKLSSGDKTRCKSVDKLLNADHWNRKEHEPRSQWVEIIYKVHGDSLFDVVQEAVDEAVRAGTLPSDPPAGA